VSSSWPETVAGSPVARGEGVAGGDALGVEGAADGRIPGALGAARLGSGTLGRGSDGNGSGVGVGVGRGVGRGVGVGVGRGVAAGATVRVTVTVADQPSPSVTRYWNKPPLPNPPPGSSRNPPFGDRSRDPLTPPPTSSAVRESPSASVSLARTPGALTVKVPPDQVYESALATGVALVTVREAVVASSAPLGR
jgi:hypothetical protein